MIYTCTVPGCGRSFEQGGDHLPEPCAPCYRAGWRTDAFGNTTRLQPKAPPPSACPSCGVSDATARCRWCGAWKVAA